MSKIKVAIGYYPHKIMHSTNWKNAWVDYCVENKIDYELVDCYKSDIIEQLKNFSHLLWHFGNYEFQDMLFARSILYSAKKMGLKIFPDYPDAWHFDDKIAETYLLQSINAPIPNSTIIYRFKDCVTMVKKNEINFPVVAKLRGGSGSHNVKMLRSQSELLRYAKKMFKSGLNPSPSLLYKASSSAKSSKNWDTFIKRLKRAPEFLRTLNSAKKFPNEKEYVFLQEFIPNNGYDLKIVVVGDKFSFIGRNIRKGEFRASGGGALFYDKDYVTKSIIDSAFRVSDSSGFQCMGYDYVVNKETGEGLIIEISYGFSHEAVLAAGGYFDRDGNWYEEPLNAPQELLINLLNK